MEFYHEFDPGFEYYFDRGFHGGPAAGFGLGEGIAAVLLAGFVFAMLVVLAVGAAVYVMQAISLQTIAKKRGLANTWLAWVPIGSSWLLGAVADDINVRSGKQTNYALVLLVVTAASAAGGASLFLLPLLGLFSIPVSIAVTVVFYIALYEIYRDYAPENAVLFLVLSILLNISWILLFVLRDRRPVSLGGGSAPQPEPAPQASPTAVPPQPAPPQPPLGWAPDPAQQRQAPPQPKECPPEHWGGIMTAESAAPCQQEENSPENTNNRMNIEGENNNEQDPA